MYLLDHSSEVEVIRCVNCTIFIGPVDGPAIFEDCSNCKVAVASQQFQAKGCHDCSFGLYSATGPTLSHCDGICISPWCGSYTHLDAHFQSANLDPKKNQFSNVYDASQVEGDGVVPNFTVSMEPGEPWVICDVHADPDEEEKGDSVSHTDTILMDEPHNCKDNSKEGSSAAYGAVPHISKGEGLEELADRESLGLDHACTSDGWIKAVKNHPSETKFQMMHETCFGEEEWRKTLDLIDLDKNSNLSRFKSVLLSMCNDDQ